MADQVEPSLRVECAGIYISTHNRIKIMVNKVSL